MLEKTGAVKRSKSKSKGGRPKVAANFTLRKEMSLPEVQSQTSSKPECIALSQSDSQLRHESLPSEQQAKPVDQHHEAEQLIIHQGDDNHRDTDNFNTTEPSKSVESANAVNDFFSVSIHLENKTSQLNLLNY